jgi:hypothetical protein
MRTLLAALLVLIAVGCQAAPIQDLRLSWRGVGRSPRATPSVSAALSQVPIAFGLRDVRPDPSFVGTHQRENVPVRTSDSVAVFCSTQVGEMLRMAGARFEERPQAVIEAELVELRVDEGGRFNGQAVLRFIVRTGAGEWTRTYQGASHRWGRTHSVDNFNEALSNSLAEATSRLLVDESFAQALLGYVGPPAPGPYAP